MTKAETDHQLKSLRILGLAFADRPIVVTAVKRKANRLRRVLRHSARRRGARVRPAGRRVAKRRDASDRSSSRSGDSGEPHEPPPPSDRGAA